MKSTLIKEVRLIDEFGECVTTLKPQEFFFKKKRNLFQRIIDSILNKLGIEE